jgi:DedD protein
MGLFSFLRKNKQQTDPDQGVYRSRADTGIGPDAEQAELPLRARKARTGKAANQQNEAVDPVLPEKKRARRRLVGAVALVLGVVIVLPMILDSEPKPLADDIAIQIPSRDTQAASASASAAASVNSSGLDKQEEIVDPASSTPPAAAAVKPPAAAAAPTTTTAAVKPAAPDSLAAVTPPMPAPKPVPPMVAPKPEAKPKPDLKPKAEAKPKPEPAADKGDDSARALAILDGHSDAAPAPEKKPGKFVLQVAALASQDKVNELQGKLKEAGIHSYTQKVPTAGGERIRIRVGPFSSKEEAEKARAKLVKLGLSGSLIPG